MAGDWIKMRVMLRRDPKVIMMTDYLSGQREFLDWLTDPVHRTCKETAYEHVTCNVMCHVTVSLLLCVWGVVREQGRRENDDLVVDHCLVSAIDEICGVPCFGAAMESVEWVASDTFTNAKGVECERVIFPNFFRETLSTEDRYRAKNAERQERFRAKKSVTNNVTENVTVTHREEKSIKNIYTIAGASEVSGKVAEPSVASGQTELTGLMDRQAAALQQQPPTIQEVLHAGSMAGVTPDICQQFFDHYSATTWLDANGRNMVFSWRAKLMHWKATEAERKAKERATGRTRIAPADDNKDFDKGF